ncbi:MAG: alpha/beta fold hydrolase [Thaumarchaeota archaeon]|nr:alpha/beta fold hydrolase [Nitrososphaerota archaeon]
MLATFDESLKEQKTFFYSGLGYKLSAIFYAPDDLKPGEKRGGIIICHGYAGWKERNSPKIARRLVDEGYCCLAFDYRGFGESEGPRWRLIPLEQVEDIRNALTYMETREEVDPRKLGLWGMSLGGSMVVYAAAIDERVRCAISVSGVGDGGRWLRSLRREWEWIEFLRILEEDRRMRVITGKSRSVHPLEIMTPPPETEQSWKESYKQYPERELMKIPLECAEALMSFRPETVAGRISPRAVMFVSSKWDPLTPHVEQVSMHQVAGEPKKLYVVEAEKHYIEADPVVFEKVMTEGASWLNQYMPGRKI